jgi:hypothetical protein
MLLEILFFIILLFIILGPIFLVNLFPGPELVVFLILYLVIVFCLIAVLGLIVSWRRA